MNTSARGLSGTGQMIPLIQAKRLALVAICRKYPVARLSLCGSAVDADAFDLARSDVDLLVEFQPLNPQAHKNAFFGLQAELEQLFQRRVDLIEPQTLRNPYVRQAIAQQRETLYVLA